MVCRIRQLACRWLLTAGLVLGGVWLLRIFTGRDLDVPRPTSEVTPRWQPREPPVAVDANRPSNAPPSEEDYVRRLAVSLTKSAKDDHEKVRSIFQWVAQNIRYEGRFREMSAEGVLKNRNAVCAGYAQLFERLCGEANIDVVTINGFARGDAGLALGVEADRSNHAWNAVRIDGKWHLLDVTWRSGSVDKGRLSSAECDSDWFLTPPEQFIHTHFPDEARWQLLDPPVTRKQFNEMPDAKPAFFRYGLKLLSHPQAIIQTADRVTVMVAVPEDVELAPALTKWKTLLDKSLTFAQRNGNRYEIHVVFPYAGVYGLVISAKPKKETTEYDTARVYRIEASSGAGDGAAFPVQLDVFAEKSALLYGPWEHCLAAGKSHRFSLSVPRADGVAVITGKTWNHLKLLGDKFEGDVVIGTGPVHVGVHFPGDEEEKYQVLLKYVGKHSPFGGTSPNITARRR
jgi:hypothetical protein